MSPTMAAAWRVLRAANHADRVLHDLRAARVLDHLHWSLCAQAQAEASARKSNAHLVEVGTISSESLALQARQLANQSA